MKILPSLIVGSLAIDANLWTSSALGGYERASCDCEISCTEPKISETCGADVVVGIDMQNFNEEKKELAQNFVNYLVDQLDVNLGFDSETRNSARLAIFGFADDDSVSSPLSFSMYDGNYDIKTLAQNAFGTDGSGIDLWAYAGKQTDLSVGFERAYEQFDMFERSRKVLDEIEKYDFEHERVIIFITDGRVQSSEKQVKYEDTMKEAKVFSISFNRLENCNPNHGTCPNSQLLETVSDFVIDGKLGEAVAAREVMEMISANKCNYSGQCKPCNCECDFPRGSAGEQGPPGCEGIRGECGDSGVPGKSGIDGEQGEPGIVGPKGQCGPCGIPGFPGSRGEPGPSGVDGIDGNFGMNGVQGPSGPPGVEGAKGIKGYKGAPGQDGMQGPDGIRGDKGVVGQIGVPGDVILNIGGPSGNPKFATANRNKRSTSNELDDIVEALSEINLGEVVSRWKRQNNVAAGIAAANEEFRSKETQARDTAEQMRMDAANLAQQQRIERNLEEFNRYNKYLEEYYNDESLRKMSSSVREVVQEWMDMNKDVIECLLNCGVCGGDNDDKAIVTDDSSTAVLRCEEPVDVIFMVDGSDSVSASDWPLVLQWTNNLIDQISPTDREYASTAVFQQFSRDPITKEIPPPLLGTFNPGDSGSIQDFKEGVLGQQQNAQGTNTYDTMNEIFKENGIFDNLPSVKGQEIDGEIKKGAPVFIILTDGEARDKDKRREEVIQKYRSMSRMQIAVGVGSNFNRDELKDFTTNENLILHYDDYNQLAEAGQQIIALVQAGCKSRRNTANAEQSLYLEGADPLDPSMDYVIDDHVYDDVIDPASDAFSLDLEAYELSQAGYNVDPEYDFLEWPYYRREDRRH